MADQHMAAAEAQDNLLTGMTMVADVHGQDRQSKVPRLRIGSCPGGDESHDEAAD